MHDLIFNKMNKNLGILSFAQGDYKAGIDLIEKYLQYLQGLIESNTDNKEYTEEKNKTLKEFKLTLLEVAQKLFADDNWLECLKCCQYLIKHNISNSDVYKFAAVCFKNLKDYSAAINLFKVYEKKAPDDKSVLYLLAETLYEYKPEQYAEDAIKLYKKYLEVYPKDHSAYNKIGAIYACTLDLFSTSADRQLFYFRKAAKYKPDDYQYLRNVHLSLLSIGDFRLAKAVYDRIYELHGKNFTHDQYYDYAAFQINIGNFKKGWDLLDHRFMKESHRTAYPDMPVPLWNGKNNISKNTLLVHHEQGFGDVVMYIRFVEHIKHLAKKVIVFVPDELLFLFQESKFDFEVVGRSVGLENIDFDYHIPMISLPRIYNISTTNIPNTTGYLNVHPRRVEDFKNRYVTSEKFKVGVCFEGDSLGKRHLRDVDWGYLSELSKNENIQLYCLKREYNEAFFKNINQDINIICLGKYFQSFADTAAAIKSMDLVVSTDNVILNLAGALGVKTLGLFNLYREFRWHGIEKGKVLWYDSVTPIVTPRKNDWEPVIEEVKARIDKLSNTQ